MNSGPGHFFHTRRLFEQFLCSKYSLGVVWMSKLASTRVFLKSTDRILSETRPTYTYVFRSLISLFKSSSRFEYNVKQVIASRKIPQLDKSWQLWEDALKAVSMCGCFEETILKTFNKNGTFILESNTEFGYRVSTKLFVKLITIYFTHDSSNWTAYLPSNKVLSA